MEAAPRSPADAERLRVAPAVRLCPEVMKACFFVWLLYYKAGNLAEAVLGFQLGSCVLAIAAEWHRAKASLV